jgi:hypothetical protein
MEEQQLLAVEAEIRAILESVGLQWILESVDDAIASGLSIEKGITIRQRRRWTRAGYEDEEVAEIVQPGSRERPQRITLVVATARGCIAAVHYENVHGARVNDLIFRTSPGRLYSTAQDYTHAVIQFGPRTPLLEAHIGVMVQGNSGVRHECDVVVLDSDEARTCRQVGASPRSRKCILAIECKYYLTSLPLGVARGFAGLKDDLGQTRVIFSANTTSDKVRKYLAHHRLTQELQCDEPTQVPAV